MITTEDVASAAANGRSTDEVLVDDVAEHLERAADDLDGM